LLERNDGESFTDDLGDPMMDGFEFYSNEGKYTIYENKNYAPFGFTYDFYVTKEQADQCNDYDRSHLMCKAILLSDEQIAEYGYFLDNIEKYPTEDGLTIDNVLSFGFDDDELAIDSGRLRENSVTYFERTKTGFSAEITTETDQLVFFSVPFEEGWSAKVNGAKTKIEKVNIGFMAVFVPAGTNKITFEYETPGLMIGIKISAAAFIILFIYLLVFVFVIRKNKRKGNAYPEGDELLKNWKKEVSEEKIKNASEEFACLLPIEKERETPKEVELTNEDMYGADLGFNRGFWINEDDKDE
jgi:uncharacterized membrane protein YfhO